MIAAYKTADSARRVAGTPTYAGEAPETVLRRLRLITPTATEGGVSQEASELNWLQDVYSLSRCDRTDDAIDLLFKRMNTALEQQNFSACNSALMALDLKRIDIDLMIGFLSITLPARSALAYRAKLVAKIERLLNDVAPNRVSALLAGLR